MSADSERPPESTAPQPSSQTRLDEARRAYQQAVSSGAKPRIEQYLGRVSQAQRALLFRDLLQLELQQYQTRERMSKRAEFAARFPDLVDVVDEVFGSQPTEDGRDTSSNSAAGRDELRQNPGGNGARAHRYASGDTIGRFTILSVVGDGSFGTVYKAFDNQLQRTVAIKAPHPELLEFGCDKESFFDEVRTVAAMKHSGIVAVYDVIRGRDDEPLLIMEFVEGGSLADLLASGPVSPERAADLIAQVAEAADHAHRRGFVHRDLKPANVLLDADDRIRIADFGLAVHEDAQRLHMGQQSGTPSYMAPEQVRGEVDHLDGRTDIWAMGIMLYRMLCGRLPFTGGTREELNDQIEHRDAKPPRQIRRDVPAELERVCLKCLARSMVDRYPAARDLARDLQRWQRPRRRIDGRLAAGAAVVVLLTILAAHWVGTHNGEPPEPADSTRHSVGAPAHPAPPTAPPSAPLSNPPSAKPAVLSATWDVVVWSQQDPNRQGIGIRDHGALPLRPGDRIRIEAKLNRKAYVYLLWVDAAGAVAPVYPWQRGDWAGRPEEELPVDHLRLPDAGDEGWAVQPPLGTETLLLLARDEPLPPDVRLADLMDAPPAGPMRDPETAVWFSDGKWEAEDVDQMRSVDLSHSRKIDDALLAMHTRLDKRLAAYFRLRRAVTFASGEGR